VVAWTWYGLAAVAGLHRRGVGQAWLRDPRAVRVERFDGGAADEVALGAQPQREAEAGLVGVVLGGHVGAEGAVALLQPEAVEGAPARGQHAEAPSGLPERVPQPQPQLGAGVQLPAELADVGDAHRQSRDLADVQPGPVEVAHAAVDEAGARARRHQAAG